jgi:hypothetical protein
MGRGVRGGFRPSVARSPAASLGRSLAASLGLALSLVLSPALLPSGLEAQRVPALAPPPAADTVPVDPPASPRDRALERLRAMPTTPVQRDTVAEAAARAAAEAAAAVEDEWPEGRPPGERGVEVIIEPHVELGERRAWTSDTTDVVLQEAEVRALLRGLRGYVATEYRGDSAVFEGEGNRLQLMGDGRVARDGAAMETDSMLVYTGDTGIVCGYGAPILTGDEADPIESDRVCYDINRRLGMADRARTQFQQGGTWYVRGPQNRVFVLAGETGNQIYAERAQFTSCDLPEPHYTFQARSLKMVENDVMVARNVTLRFGDVPVFWLPWMAQSLKPDRRSGMLTPQFGVNDIVRNSSGYNRHISNLGFYWAVSDYVSALVAGEWYSNNYTALEGNVTYAWTRQFLMGRLAVKQYWQHAEFGTGQRNMSISTQNSWRPDERSNVRVAGDYTTSTALVRDYSFDPRELNRQIASSAGVDRSFGWGSMSLSAQRRQQITDDQVNWQLPSFSLSVRPITLFAGDDGTGGLTLSGSGNVNRALREINHDLTPQARGHETVNASVRQSLSWGRLSLSQDLQFRDQTDAARPEYEGSGGLVPALPQTDAQDLGWGTSLSFQQTLWPGTTISPNISVRGRQIRGDTTGGVYLAEPNRISAGASLGTTVFGFWPGFGEYERIRHKISPTLNWSYSPAPTPSPLQESIFGLQNLREQNRIGFSFNQTFEAKVRGDEEETAAAPAGARNGARNGARTPTDEEAGVEGEVDPDFDPELNPRGDMDAPQRRQDPSTLLDREGDGDLRRMPRSRTVNLLSINTATTFQYDFVEAREEGRGFLTEEVTNSLRSDLVPGFQVNMTHSLFERGEAPTDGLTPRTFRPYLTQLNTGFTLDQNFWLLRMLGLTGTGEPRPDEHLHDGRDQTPTLHEGLDLDQRDIGSGSMVPRVGSAPTRAGPGGWRATLSYALNRPRPLATALPGQGLATQTQQTVNGSLSFRPTEHWSVDWRTSYSFTTGDFDSHILTLARDLHRWQANFDFIKSPNGNFAMQFRVRLLDNPDIKVDYDQRTDPSDRLRMQQEQ